jgi:hypothetical protein
MLSSLKEKEEQSNATNKYIFFVVEFVIARNFNKNIKLQIFKSPSRENNYVHD